MLPTNVEVIDFETTDKDPKKAHPVEFAKVSATREYQCFIQCPIPIPPEVSAIHHITNADIEAIGERAWPWDQLQKQILNPPEGTIYVAHFAKYEQGVIGPGYETIPWICTYKVALRLWPDAPNHKNETLRYYLNLGPRGRSCSQASHSALHDAKVTSLILLAALEKGATLEQMIQWTKEPALLPKISFGKYAGSKWEDIELGYLQWICKQPDMDTDVVACAALEIQRRREAASAAPRPR